MSKARYELRPSDGSSRPSSTATSNLASPIASASDGVYRVSIELIV